MKFIRFDCQSLKWARFGIIADLVCYLPQSFCFGLRQRLVALFICQAFIGRLVLDIIKLAYRFVYSSLVINRKFV